MLESWEQSAKNIKALTEERKFYKRKLEIFFKSQSIIDDQVLSSFVAAAKPVNDSNKPAQ
jgi:hypothetical protein